MTKMSGRADASTTRVAHLYTHDVLTREPTQVAEGGSSAAVYLYEDAGARTRLTYGNTSYTEYFYSGAGNLTLVANRKSDATLISGFTYYVDDTGNRTKMSIAASFSNVRPSGR
jgi:hypothetical protein